MALGAQRRQHTLAIMLRAAAPGLAAACVSAVAIYVVVMLLAGRRDWNNIFVVAAAAAFIPVLITALLVSGPRLSYPVTRSVLMMVFAASFVTAVVSALRVPISYIGLFLTLPTSLFFVTLANVAVARRLQRLVALLDFSGASAVAAAAGWAVPIIAVDDRAAGYKRVLIDPDTHHTPEWTQALARLYMRGIQLEAWPTFLEGTLGRVDLTRFDLSHVSYTPSQIFYYKAKRAFDLLALGLLAIPGIVLFGVIWAYIRVLDGGPALFVQDRRGRAGSTFRLYKFRTMYRGDHVGSTEAADVRIIPGCRLLRQLRLDELPQFINIARGDMSFIGPRPVSVSVAEALEARIDHYVDRQILVPGLTGWAQVSQGYATTDDEEIEKLAFDLYYLKHVSLDLDIIITFRTIRTVLFRIGAR